MPNTQTKAPSTDDIRRAMVTLAAVIRKHGDAPWPIMERLQRELQAIEDREALLETLLADRANPAGEASFG
ncbi:MAG: hypothetical protein ACSHX3_01780 [Litorimonas sp.]